MVISLPAAALFHQARQVSFRIVDIDHLHETRLSSVLRSFTAGLERRVDSANVVGHDLRIGRDESQVFAFRLRHQHAVKGIAVIEGQRCERPTRVPS